MKHSPSYQVVYLCRGLEICVGWDLDREEAFECVYRHSLSNIACKIIEQKEKQHEEPSSETCT